MNALRALVILNFILFLVTIAIATAYAPLMVGLFSGLVVGTAAYIVAKVLCWVFIYFVVGHILSFVTYGLMKLFGFSTPKAAV